MGVGQSRGRVTPSCPRAIFRLRSGLPLRLAPRVCARLTGLPFHMAGIQWGLARGPGRRTYGPVREAGDGGACGGGVTVGQQPRPARVGARAEGMVPSGQRSEALSRGLRGLPNLLTYTHSHTQTRARTHGYPRFLHARVHRGHTPTWAHWLPCTTPAHTKSHDVNSHPIMYTHTVHTSLNSDSPLSLRASSAEHLQSNGRGMAVVGADMRPPAPSLGPVPSLLLYSLWNPCPTPTPHTHTHTHTHTPLPPKLLGK